ncbi:MAG TPA: 6-carboxytetrahydropterin synthase [Bryobacteraceae bacterium]|nr:6-carboxytetrahydropterin synthase [Bryobacteraceae bacterium]
MLITRKAEFSASHVTARPDWSAERNAEVYGEAANEHGHGHNYQLEVTLSGEPDPVTGMVLDLKELKQILEREVILPFDHHHLNREVPPFDQIVPTTENVAREIWRRLAPHFDGSTPPSPVRLHNVRLWETEDVYVDYSEENG